MSLQKLITDINNINTQIQNINFKIKQCNNKLSSVIPEYNKAKFKWYFESKLLQYFYPVSEKPEIIKDCITVTQNAGHRYYKVDGAGINGAFANQYSQYGTLLKEINKYLSNVYNNNQESKYGNVLVPIYQMPSYNSKLAEFMMYSIGPDMSGQTLLMKNNEKLIENIYKDAIQMIIDHNKNNEIKITCFRPTLLSIGIFAPKFKNNTEKINYYQTLIKLIIESIKEKLDDSNNKYIKSVLFQEDPHLPNLNKNEYQSIIDSTMKGFEF